MTVAPAYAPPTTMNATATSTARVRPASAPPPSPAAAPALRLLPVPQSAPPYDDEVPDEHVDAGRDHDADGASESVVQGALALAFALPGGLPVEPEPPPTLCLVAAGPDKDQDEDEDDELRPRPTPRAALPNPRLWAARLVQALVEVVAGERPNAQLVRWTSTDVHEQLAPRVRHVAAVGAPGTRRMPRWLVRSVHVSEPADGVAEVCALVARAGRPAALALRLEGVDGRWRCTALELGW
jgi:hypothetical protein